MIDNTILNSEKMMKHRNIKLNTHVSLIGWQWI